MALDRVSEESSSGVKEACYRQPRAGDQDMQRQAALVPVAEACPSSALRSRLSDMPGGDGRSLATRRPCARGKFLWVGREKLYVKGVTYGTFRPNERGEEFHDPDKVAKDFALMEAQGVNAVRTYTVPPRWLLDLAQEQGLRVMIGLPWEQHVDILRDRRYRRTIESKVRNGVASCAGHPAVLCYAVGNEIPAPLARWSGRRKLERFLEQLYFAAKDEDPEGLVTYVNYPSTEYLELPFVDLFCFNVYLENQPAQEAYLARLHNLAGERPLLLAEVGLDSRRHGEAGQAHSLEWQVRTVMASGCAGAFVFAWTDEWYRGGFDIEDWDFGLTRRNRDPKPALAAVQKVFRETPFPARTIWPRVSVVVCTHNGARTLRECLAGLRALDYPDYEVILVNDGSSDHSAEIARPFRVRLITTENRGLSAARNTGLAAATGEFVAYIDDDAFPGPHWLKYLVATFQAGPWAAVGGPNLLPPHSGRLAECIYHAPGGPNHVLVSDREAEHIPGCNMAFRKQALEAIGGFDPRFRTAGDDVDACWRLQERGWKIGYSPSAVVWHYRRNSLRNYWKQQIGYGRAEALLERRWPDKYNSAGHAKWQGRIYGRGLTRLLGQVTHVYHGMWGTAPFQLRRESVPWLVSHLPTMPEWLLVILGLALLSALGLVWSKLLFVLPLLGGAIAISLIQAWCSVPLVLFAAPGRPWIERQKLRLVTFFLHLLQPLARLWGRARFGLLLGFSRELHGFCWPSPRQTAVWRESWQSPEARLAQLERVLRSRGAVLVHGGEYDRWDFEVLGGLMAGARLLMAIEEHGAGKQLVRFRLWPRLRPGSLVLISAGSILTALASLDGSVTGAFLLGGLTVVAAGRMLAEAGSTMAALGEATAPGSLQDD